MIEMCSCVECVSSSGTSSSSIGSGTLRGGDRQDSMMALTHARRWTLRSGRPFRGICFLTATLTFCIGLGLGLLVSIYCLPDSNFLHRTSEDRKGLDPEVKEPLTAVNSESARRVEEESSIRPGLSSRFPEFAHIQDLVKGGSNEVDPILRRPSPNVHFISTANRILSLHPVQTKIPVLSPPLNLKYPPRNNKYLKRQGDGDSSSMVRKVQVASAMSSSLLPQSDTTRNLLDGIYWSQDVESQLPAGFSDYQLELWRDFVHNSSVTNMEEGCGRMQNRLLTLDNATRACCRYRQNADQIQGEIFSFYLSQLLGIRNVAPSALNIIQTTGNQWAPVRNQLTIAQWTDEKPVVLTQFIPNLTPAHIPLPLRDSKRSLHPADVLNSVSPLNVTELAQWSDLIVFDYLTANLDRIVNNLFNFQWNPSMMDAPAHNLVLDESTGLLVFLDNESGLLHGYRLLDKYEVYHRLMLDSLCVFRRSTADKIKKLFNQKNVGLELKRMFEHLEPVALDYLPMLPERSVNILNRRIEVVHNQILKCESLYDLP